MAQEVLAQQVIPLQDALAQTAIPEMVRKRQFKVSVVGAGGLYRAMRNAGLATRSFVAGRANIVENVRVIDRNGGKEDITLQVWDAGSTNVSPSAYARMSSAAIFTFDMSDAGSLFLLEDCLALVTALDVCGEDILRTSFLVGISTDWQLSCLTEEQAATINDFMAAHGIAGGFWQLSRGGDGIVELFDRAVEWILWYADAAAEGAM